MSQQTPAATVIPSDHEAAERTISSAALADLIDHTLLKPEVKEADISRLCQEAIEHGFKAVCVNSGYIALAAELLRDQKPFPSAVIGCPLGAALSSAKAFEARAAIEAGAREIDMVIALGALKSRNYQYVLADIQAVVEASAPRPVKVILETGSLADEEKVIACALAKAAGAAFVKTSTGFAGSGATESDIVLMRRIIGPEMGLKASGGIKTRQDAERLIRAGANRLGASASVAIVTATANP